MSENKNPRPRNRTGAPAGRVPRWATAVAIAIPLCVLPSAAWRAQHGIQVIASGPGQCGVQTNGEAGYVVSLSVVSVVAALFSFALVRPWGEALPRWIPCAGGRSIPAWLVGGGGALMATLVGGLTLYYLAKEAFGLGGVVEARELPAGCSAPGWDVLVWYVPLVAWAPMLAALTLQYVRRRQGELPRQRPSVRSRRLSDAGR